MDMEVCGVFFLSQVLFQAPGIAWGIYVVGPAGGLNLLMDHRLLLGKPELKGFNLNPLNQDELKALKIILKG